MSQGETIMPPLDGTALLKKVKTHELEALGTSEALLSRISSLDGLLEAAYNIRCPGPSDQESRRDLIRIFNVISNELYGKVCPVVVEFGSFVMNMFSSDSDLDLSINFNHRAVDLSRKERINALRRFAARFRKLQSRGLVKNVLLVPARVPVLKVTDCGTNIECDFSVDNRDGITKSQIVFLIATIDERFRKLSFMMKAWAKAHGINSSKDGTLNSLSLILLSAFHLQCTEPPILPPFSALLRDGCDPPNVMKNVVPFLNYGQKNKESLVQLFVTLLIRLKSVESLWAEGLCVSVYEGSWIHKTFSKKRTITVEDFSDRSQNVTRAVHPKKVIDIYKSINKSLSQIKDYVDGKIQGRELEKQLFGPCPLRETKHVTTHAQCAPVNHVLHDPAKKVNPASMGVMIHDKSAHPVLHDPTRKKKKRLAAKDGTSASGPSKAARTHEPTSSKREVTSASRSPRVVRTHDPVSSKREVTSGPSIGNRRKRSGQSLSSRTGGTSQIRQRMTREDEGYGRRGSYAIKNPSSFTHRTEGIRVHERIHTPLFAHEHSISERSYAPLYAHELSSSERSYAPLFAHELPSSERSHAPLFAHELPSSERSHALLFARERSFAGYPPTLHSIPFDRSPRSAIGYPASIPNVPPYPPPQHAARFPLRDRVLNPFFDQVRHNRDRFPQPSYPGREQIWSDHPNEPPRRVHQPPFYR